jgi:MarR family transcriptional regulator, 2-MHQ and catechol-resistance regulon repressor
MTHRAVNQESRALAAFVKLLRATEAVSVSVHRHLAEERLTVSQFGILEALYHCGSMCQKELAGKILKTTGNITMVLDNLEKRGLVERRRSTEDRRFVQVQLTVAGRRLIGRIFPAHAERIRRRMAVLDQEELNYLEKLLKKLGRARRVENGSEESTVQHEETRGQTDRQRDSVRTTTKRSGPRVT